MWHYSLDGKTLGPIDDSTLRQMLSSGQLDGSTPVWREGMAQWMPAAQCGLAAPIAGQVPYYGVPTTPQGDNTGGLIPYKNPKALTGYYMGVGALIPCIGLFLGPAALILGFQGLNYAKANPVVKGATHAWVAIILGGLSTLVNWGSVIAMVIGALANA